MSKYPEYRYTIYVKRTYTFPAVDDEMAKKAVPGAKMILLGNTVFPSPSHDGVTEKIINESLEKIELFRDEDVEYVGERTLMRSEEKSDEEAPRGVCCHVAFDEKEEGT